MVLIITLLCGLSVLPVSAQSLNLQDVTLRTEDTVYLQPPPPLQLELYRYHLLEQQRAFIDPPMLNLPMVNESTTISLLLSPTGETAPLLGEAPDPDPLWGDLIYTPGEFIGAQFRWSRWSRSDNTWVNGFQLDLGIADGWINPLPDTVSHATAGYTLQGNRAPLFLDFGAQVGYYLHPSEVTLYQLQLQRGLQLRSDKVEIKESTLFIGQNRVIQPVGVSVMEGVLGEDFQLIGPGNILRVYTRIQGLVWGNLSTTNLDGAGQFSLGLRWTPVRLTINLGASAVLDNNGFDLYPDISIRVSLLPPLSLILEADYYLSSPAGPAMESDTQSVLDPGGSIAAFIALEAPSETSLFPAEGVLSMGTRLNLDLSPEFFADLGFRYLDGNQLLPGEGLMIQQQIGQLRASVDWRPAAGISFNCLGQVLFSLQNPFGQPYSYGLQGDLDLAFINTPIGIIIKTIWGESTVPNFSLQNRWELFSGLMISLEATYIFQNEHLLFVGAGVFDPFQDVNWRMFVGYRIRS